MIWARSSSPAWSALLPPQELDQPVALVVGHGASVARLRALRLTHRAPGGPYEIVCPTIWAVVRGPGGQLRSLVCASLVLLAGCRGAARQPDPSYFTIRPVTSEFTPPCAPPALAEQHDGQAVRCYDVGPAGVDARDVKSATVIVDPRTGQHAVEFDLSPRGTERFNTLARTVGVGGLAAIVVDGVVVSTPRFDTTQFPGKGRVTGLDAGQAERLTHRLNGR